MRVIPTDLPGVLVIEPDIYRDERGFFLEQFQAKRYEEAGGDRPDFDVAKRAKFAAGAGR